MDAPTVNPQWVIHTSPQKTLTKTSPTFWMTSNHQKRWKQTVWVSTVSARLTGGLKHDYETKHSSNRSTFSRESQHQPFMKRSRIFIITQDIKTKKVESNYYNLRTADTNVVSFKQDKDKRQIKNTCQCLCDHMTAALLADQTFACEGFWCQIFTNQRTDPIRTPVLLCLPERIPVGKGKSAGAAWRVSGEQKDR